MLCCAEGRDLWARRGVRNGFRSRNRRLGRSTGARQWQSSQARGGSSSEGVLAGDKFSLGTASAAGTLHTGAGASTRSMRRSRCCDTGPVPQKRQGIARPGCSCMQPAHAMAVPRLKTAAQLALCEQACAAAAVITGAFEPGPPHAGKAEHRASDAGYRWCVA